MIAACYARKSTAEEKDDRDKSVARQIERAHEYARAKGWRLDDRYIYQDDAVSGAEFKRRPGLNALREALTATRPPFQLLIVSEQSRLGRDTIRTLALIQAIQDSGVRVYSYLDDREISVADEMGEVEGFMKSWASSQERRKASQRTRDALKLRVERGQPVGGTLYGYTKGVINRVEADIVKRIFKRRAEGAGYFKIARELERDGIRSPRSVKGWNQSQIASIVSNETYHGVKVWGRTRRVKRKGTTVIEASPDTIIRTPVPTLRIIDEKLWLTVQDVNHQAEANAGRGSDGPRKSRPTASKWLLSPFIACGVCGGSMHAKKSGQHYRYVCTARHMWGAAKCSNPRGLAVTIADKVLLDAFEEALAGKIVLDALDEVLDGHRRRSLDPAPLKAEVQALKVEISNLVAGLAKGDLEDIHDAVRDRRARLEHLEGQLQGIGAARDFDLAEFTEKVGPLLKNWREHLRKNPHTAQQVLRKILPTKVTITPLANGGWKFSGLADYTKVLQELGLDAVTRVLEEATAKSSGSPARRAWHRGPRTA
jgi:site-specific DNA recombinase